MSDGTAVPDFTPRYYAIEQALRARIAELAPNDPLPSEAELSQEFGVSRMTARAAVTRLVSEGLVYRQSGRGTFVAAPPTRRRADSLIRFSQEMRRQGRQPSSQVVEVVRRGATPAETGRLRLPRNAGVIAIHRVRLADQTPVAVEHAVFPGKLAPLLDMDLANGSLHEALVTLGHVPTLGHATLSAANAGTTEAQLLRVETGAALLVERRLILDQDGKPLELTESRYVGDRYALDVTFDVQHP
ncbi:GntR family transcriptional regulator [Micromonospora sp. KC213]|uniref:GntR family transcriptional regulator n=1 Tax=Micromonospora sp. KC213 TaxID=2530378 RepID=UPI001051BAA6|nr:GntR family transcriptional regulator [Micromonospora sp. KC213]TDC41904.1 GntR family transcriptional regulator [Micromonospora sp. KC213]